MNDDFIIHIVLQHFFPTFFYFENVMEEHNNLKRLSLWKAINSAYRTTCAYKFLRTTSRQYYQKKCYLTSFYSHINSSTWNFVFVVRIRCSWCKYCSIGRNLSDYVFISCSSLMQFFTPISIHIYVQLL